MRILAFSDVCRWEEYERLVDHCKPDVVALAGDLTSDGFAAFWNDALQFVPEFLKKKRALFRRFGAIEHDGVIQVRSTSAGSMAFLSRLGELKQRYRKTSAFRKARKRIHVNKFYDFLRYAGRRSTVLVVAGDHEDDFVGDYDARRVNRISGCREISGKLCAVEGQTFLGLGFEQGGFRRPLRALISTLRDHVDVLIAHAPQRNVRLLAEFKPRLIIRGHFGWGAYLIDGIPTVFTSAGHAIIDIGKRGPPRIRQSSHATFADLSQDYDWLRPYPKNRYHPHPGHGPT